MLDELLEKLRPAISGTRALESVRALARFHRVQASPGYDQATDWIAERASTAGLEVEIERVPGDGHTRFLGQPMPEGWSCARAVAILHDAGSTERLCDVEAEPLSLVLRSTPARGRYPLVAVGEGTEPGDYQGLAIEGHVVLASGGVHRVHELAVLERGAAGILTDTRRLVPPVRERDDERDALNYTSFWWSEDEPRGWGFVISPRVGDRLRERLAAGAPLELEVDIDSRAFATTIPLLSAILRGKTDAEVLLVSHLCHPQPSANDNASGAAANLETARVLAEMFKDDPPLRSIRFLWVPELTGTCAFVGRDPARVARIVAALNLDMVGESQERCGSTFLLEHPPCFAASFAEELLARIRARALDWVSSYSGPGHYSMTRVAEVPYGGGSDHAVLVDPAVGVPCPMLIQWPDRFYHSSHDTPDKTDPASLALAVRCAGTYAAFVATASQEGTTELTALLANGAQRRLLEALTAPGPESVEREILRGCRTFASLMRLGVDPEAIDTALRAFEDFARNQGALTIRYVARTPAPPSLLRRPRRKLHGTLGFLPRLLPGWRSLSPDEREAWRRIELATADAALLGDLAWQACDGTRSIEEISELVRLETGRNAHRLVIELFDLTARLGLSDWVES